MTGIVVKGKHIGTGLGFPTANIALDAGSAPLGRDGVYLAKIAWQGRTLFAIVNQGRHPTFPEGDKTIEAHILDYAGDLYGQRVEMQYLRFMRPEAKFDSPEALKSQIKSDEEDARRMIADYMTLN